MVITKEQLIYCGVSKYRAGTFASLINKFSDKYNINTRMRMAHFLSQVLHESCCFIYLRELASGEKYEGRKDLGNIYPGDGNKFRGRGVLQITGRINYSRVSKALGVDFVSNPSLLEEPEYAVESAMWWWNKHKLNELADKDELTKITRIINGGYNGKAERLRYLGKAKRALGLIKIN